MELFFQGPNGEKGGRLFALAAPHDEYTVMLDKHALLSLRTVILEELLDAPEFEGLVFSINVAVRTLMDDKWFSTYLAEFEEKLQEKSALHRVVIEIGEHPDSDLQKWNINQQVLTNLLRFFKYSKIRFALDDVLTPGYNPTSALAAMGPSIVWWKLDHKPVQEARGSSPYLTDMIWSLIEKTTVVVEGMENNLLKKALVAEALQTQRSDRKPLEKIAVQSPTIRLRRPEKAQPTEPPVTDPDRSRPV